MEDRGRNISRVQREKQKQKPIIAEKPFVHFRRNQETLREKQGFTKYFTTIYLKIVVYKAMQYIIERKE